MIGVRDLKAVARERLRDARVLLKGGRPDGAVYLSGFAVEMALKARICRTLRWASFPDTTREFKDLRSLRTDDLEILLRFSGVDERIKTKHLAEWSIGIVPPAVDLLVSERRLDI
jgi:HEPN domain-containing protein